MNTLKRSLCVVVALCTSAAFAQQQWQWENPRPVGEDLTAVASDGARAFLVGDGCMILELNAGAFSRHACPVSGQPNLRDVVYSTGVFWAVGANGTVLRNPGTGWVAVTKPTTNLLTSVTAVSATTAWVGGVNALYLTTNSGSSWTQQGIPTGTQNLISLFASSQLSAIGTRAFLTGSESVIRTVDGMTWSAVTSTPLDAGIGPPPNTTFFDVDGVGMRAMLVGTNGTAVRVDAASGLWTTVASLGGPSFSAFASASNGSDGVVATNATSNTRHALYSVSNNYGTLTAEAVPTAVPPNLNALGAAMQGSTALVVGQGGLVETRGSGGTWSMVSTGNDFPPFLDVDVSSDAGVVIAVGGGGSSGVMRVASPPASGWGATQTCGALGLKSVALDGAGTGAVAVTTNTVCYSTNLTSWSTTTPAGAWVTVDHVEGSGNAAVYVVAGGMTVLRLTAGGATSAMVAVPTGTQPNWVSVKFPSRTMGYLIGNTGGPPVLYRSTDQGQTWVAATTPSASRAQVVSMHWFDANNGVVLTEDGRLFHTGDGAMTWDPPAAVGNCSLAAANSFKDVYMASPKLVYVLNAVCGPTGSEDQGATFVGYPPVWPTRGANAIAGPGNGTNLRDLWVVGEWNMVMRARCGGGYARACDDGNECTDDECSPMTGACSFTNNANRCDDNNVCTSGETCSAGSCTGGTRMVCDDGNVCTVDQCDAQKGCSSDAGTASTPCDDGNSCTSMDQCVGGVCRGMGVTCDDGNQCHAGACAMDGGCTFTNRTGPCNDTNACTQMDSCSNGTCTGTALNCVDSNPCTADSCNPVTGCLNVPLNAGACTTGNACITGQTCQAGTCRGGMNINCDDNDPCTDDSCDPAVGCKHTFRGVGASCNDGRACIINEVCIADGGCVGVSNNCNDDNACTRDVCSEPGGCTNNPEPMGAACSDNNACTNLDRCNGMGTCTGTALTCGDNNACTTDSCNPATGCVFAPVANGTGCDDGNSCSTGDRCVSGTCLATGGLMCNDNNPCTTDSCDSAVMQCVYTAVTAGTACSDGNACTENDACNGLAVDAGCVGMPRACNDGNACTVDSCNPDGGTCANPPATPGTMCDDTSPCTEMDSCNAAGMCEGMQKQCNDSNVCTQDRCELDGGACVFAAQAEGTTCNDGNACTPEDSCHLGVCDGGALLKCDDGVRCTADTCNALAGCINVEIAMCLEDGGTGGGGEGGGSGQGGGSGTGGEGTGGEGVQPPAIFKRGCACGTTDAGFFGVLGLLMLAWRRRYSNEKVPPTP